MKIKRKENCVKLQLYSVKCSASISSQDCHIEISLKHRSFSGIYKMILSSTI